MLAADVCGCTMIPMTMATTTVPLMIMSMTMSSMTSLPPVGRLSPTAVGVHVALGQVLPAVGGTRAARTRHPGDGDRDDRQHHDADHVEHDCPDGSHFASFVRWKSPTRRVCGRSQRGVELLHHDLRFVFQRGQ